MKFQSRLSTLFSAFAALGAAFFVPAGAADAQSGLTDIPDTDVKAQLEAFKLPEGVEINLFASDPMISKPVQMNWDAEGRLWMVSSGLYPQIQPGQAETDRVIVLEDTDKDGQADKATTFATDLHIPTAVVPGDGGAYVANSTELLFLKDNDGDGEADERRVLLSGFGTEDTHHLIHTFKFGPEGMLWFNQSIYIHSHVETPYGVRRLLGGGMWHFRPETRELEVFFKGLVNPWGHVFDKWGQSFLTDGAGFEGINYVFPRSVFKTAPGASRVLPGLNPGQPKHCGLEIATGRHIPDDWQELLIAPDFRGSRVNCFRLAEKGSYYTSTQTEDLVASTHRAFRPIDAKMGPDGALYIADWYNPIIQHGEVDFRDPRRDHEHGRIWRVTFKDRPLVETPDIKGADVDGLLAMLTAPEGYTRHFAKQELRQRGSDAVMPKLEAWVAGLDPAADDYEQKLLQAVWTAQTLNILRLDWVKTLLDSDVHNARAAGLRALYYKAASVEEAFALAKEAASDPHPQVRLWAVSVLAQLSNPETVQVALGALKGVEVDEFLDFAVWSIVREHRDRWVPLTDNGGNPFGDVRSLLYAVRALNEPVALETIVASLESGELKDVAGVADLLSKVGNAKQLARLFAVAGRETSTNDERAAVLTALNDAARLRKLKPETDLSVISGILEKSQGDAFATAAGLAGQWKVEAARDQLEKAFLTADQDPARARAALEGLRALGGQNTADLLDRTAKDESQSFLQRSLATIGRTQMNPNQGAPLAIQVLSSSPNGKDPHGIYDAFLATKQGPNALAKALDGASLPQEIALAGVQKASSAATNPEGLVKALQNAAGLEPMKMQLTPEEMQAMLTAVEKKGNAHRGESIYRRAQLQCAVCHAIGGVGGLIGPDLVSIGSSAPVDYLIESLLEPGKKIKEGYHTTLVTTKSGKAYAGAIAREDANELVVRDAAGVENRIPKSEIASNQISPVSLMPPGLTASLRQDEFIDLVRFLSELGKEGDFKMQPNRFARHWAALQPHDRTRDAVGHYGHVVYAEPFDGYEWSRAFSQVDGTLPVDELPDVKGREKTPWAVAHTYLEVTKPGKLAFDIPNTAGSFLFIDQDEVKLPEAGGTVLVPVAQGIHKVTISAIKDGGRETVSLEIIDSPEATAEVAWLPHADWPES